MKLLVIADKENEEEIKEKFEDVGELTFFNEEQVHDFSPFNWILDFKIHENQAHITKYQEYKGVVFISGQFNSTIQLKDKYAELEDLKMVGMNSMPTFINRDLLELGVFSEELSERLGNELDRMNLDYEIVEDRIGLVTPRVICMIINEAYYTVQEGTATKEAIDTAMKLGTNYPYGPFEWCDKIGINNVYAVLLSVYEDTRDPRYMICPLLKKEYNLSS